MRRLVFSIALLLSASGFTIASDISLPIACKNILNERFPGWKFAPITEEIKQYHRKNKFPDEPHLIKGDWDGDGKLDYAAMIEHGTFKLNDGSERPQNHVVIFVRRAKGFKYFRFDGGDALQKMRRGKKDYDHDSRRNFVYKNDAIFDYIWEKSGTSYVWKKNRFVGIITSD